MAPHTALDQIDEDILSAEAAVIATNGPDGLPQLSAIWFIVEDGVLKMSVTETTQKYRNLVADDRATLLIFHPAGANYYAEIRGNVSISQDRDYLFANRLGKKYSTDMRSFDTDGVRRAILALKPSKINVGDYRD
jgi:PPOX class probable F420-dependent enzyme